MSEGVGVHPCRRGHLGQDQPGMPLEADICSLTDMRVQLQRVIRTGRTGHWLNHTKEHMLVGIKNAPSINGEPPSTIKWPSWLNRGLDVDVIVSEVRETSRKPDEVYGLIERMCPGGRKVEIFGRKHNVRPGWITLGNQLGNVDMIWRDDLRERLKNRYPERQIAGGPEGQV